jgi:hypothetical protein
LPFLISVRAESPSSAVQAGSYVVVRPGDTVEIRYQYQLPDRSFRLLRVFLGRAESMPTTETPYPWFTRHVTELYAVRPGGAASPPRFWRPSDATAEGMFLAVLHSAVRVAALASRLLEEDPLFQSGAWLPTLYSEDSMRWTPPRSSPCRAQARASRSGARDEQIVLRGVLGLSIMPRSTQRVTCPMARTSSSMGCTCGWRVSRVRLG